MFLILRRDQRRSLTGKVIFRLDVHAEIEPAEMKCIEHYRLKSTVLYTKHIVVERGRGLLGLISRLLFRALNISISVGDLVHGKRVECRSIIEMLAVEDQVREAAKTFKLVLNAATHFGGEEAIEL
ncbi:hypothetical protein [Bradyrhizobium acaciae]|uniref:hypothetical protein n=1 Tax=Bradyrhizobium acaciae TaxID=2683706 RepID=UPI001E5C0F26|nr:hypothetical protein [Bradyrhizobium acaciae]MCC8977576.1 hypothetical protein [Bradyrhizobium acaciae]